MRFPGLDFQADLDESLAVIRENAPTGQPYYGLFSGSKDSVALHEVARMAGVDVEWHYNITTIDPPELVRFIRHNYPHVHFIRPRHGNFFRRAAEKKGFPTRRVRWCCEEYKESANPKGASLLMGIRGQESSRRSCRWGLVTTHFRTGSPAVNPLFYWDVGDLWGFIKGNGIAYSGLYDEGFHRLGCIGCPMAREAGRRMEFARWPRYEKRWQWVFERTWERRTGSLQRDGRRWFGDVYFAGWREMWDWWLSDRSLPKMDDLQGGLDFGPADK